MASEVIPVSIPADVLWARRAAKSAAEESGFEAKAVEEVALVASELATNLHRHAFGGRLSISTLVTKGRTGIELEARDAGPGIPNVEEAISDGFSSSGGLGLGLGTVNRLMDEFSIESSVGTGTRILCRRWSQHARAMVDHECPLKFGVASRAHPLMKENGDAFVVKQAPGLALAGLIDGLGHGQYALRAAQAARQYVENHYDQPLPAIFQGVGRACRGTRGVVMALIRFSWKEASLGGPPPVLVEFASVGNIEARFLGMGPFPRPLLRRGILGVNAASAPLVKGDWMPGGAVILHTDGISTQWREEDFPEIRALAPALAAQKILASRARDNDDATVLITVDR